ncbi:MAG: GNAT family N-acetyltransferase [Caldilineaceae bacterium]|nr:GNAT family N-acetyltransferase [Caldilineaceae bacterium]
MSTQLSDPSYIGDLGDGLIRRWSTAADQPEIGHLMGTVFRNSETEPIRPSEIDASRIYMSGNFPFMGPGDFAVVEDTQRQEHRLVACTCLFSHQWSYAGIPFGVGRPEEVATLPDYRNRGLVRALFEMVHARSTAKGDLAQAITGIPYFYRQFGYEFVLDLDGSRSVYLAAIPAKKGDNPEPYALRLATLDDIPDLHALYNARRKDSLIWHEDSPAYWQFQVGIWDDPAVKGKDVTQIGLHHRFYMIVDGDGQTCGFTKVAAKRWGRNLRISALEFAPHVNWQAAMPSLLRILSEQVQMTPVTSADVEAPLEVRFHFGRSHPAYAVLGQELAPRFDPPYAWYLRVPDLIAFLRLITPVLEERIANSIVTGYNGELKIDLYRGGLCLQFEGGKAATIEPWRPPMYGDIADVGCPPLVFLQLLFSYRSLAELRSFFPDVWTNSEAAALLIDILFPKQPSWVQPL